VESGGKEEGTASTRRLAKGKAKGKGMIYRHRPQNRNDIEEPYNSYKSPQNFPLSSIRHGHLTGGQT